MNINDEMKRRFLTTSDYWKRFVYPLRPKIIKQGYPPELEKENAFARIRETTFPDKTKVFERCNKGVSDRLTASKDERDVDPKLSQSLFNSCGKRWLEKHRHEIALTDGPTIEIDEFKTIRGEPTSLVISEIEFPNVKEEEIFVPPDWLGEEITGQHQWSNFSLCVNGVPN